eukprot:TRINITY_DN9821_c0_g1_i5.p1 TRINITY_DN9821_c0_g1~~TRINITY_DN9821_c0_g1_i5.p1  ORF type:complete len:306 (+),score=87.86 TRINITY_DN9821_c0_g1_i5:82-999(+)
MAAAEADYGATETAPPEAAADATELRLQLAESGEAGRSMRAALITRLGLAALLAAVCCGGASGYAAWRSRALALRGAEASGNETLPPAVELMREAPTTLTEYVLDPYALCKDFGHAQQPVYVGMLQSGLMSVAMTLFAMLPPPLGGGDPFHPGMVGFVFAGWNVFSALVFTCEALFIAELPSGLALSAFQRYELRWWLAAQSPKFQGMVTILMHKMASGYYTIVDPREWAGTMVGWRKYATIAIFSAAAAGLALVALPLLVTHLLAQVVLLPLGVLLNLLSLGFYEMVFSILFSTCIYILYILYI